MKAFTIIMVKNVGFTRKAGEFLDIIPTSTEKGVFKGSDPMPLT